MGTVFSAIVQSSKCLNQVGKISGRVAIALLSEGKDKLSLPFAAFAETGKGLERPEQYTKHVLLPSQ